MIDKQFDKETFKKSVKDNVKFLYRRKLEEATQEQLFQAVSYTVKDVIIDNWLATQKAYEEQDEIHYLIDMARRLEGLPRHTSMHAAGVVISRTSVDNYVPLSRAADGTITTQFTICLLYTSPSPRD